MNRIDKLMFTTWGLWGSLGFYRGHQNYKKQYKYDLIHNPKINYYYVSEFVYSVSGFAIYVFPLTMIGPIIYEAHNLERAIRGIKCDD